MIYLPLTRFKIENNNQRLFQLISKSNAELEVMKNSYANHGCTYCGLGQFKRAIKYHQRHLEIAKEMGDKAGEGVRGISATLIKVLESSKQQLSSINDT